MTGALMNDKIMLGRFYCMNSTKHCENEENIGKLYFITSPHFPMRVSYARFWRSSTHNLACALRIRRLKVLYMFMALTNSLVVLFIAVLLQIF